jgi:amidase
MKDIIYASAKSIAKAIKEKEVSSYEVVESCLKQIKKVNPKINAVVCMDEEKALSEAKKADAEQSKGHIRGPLHGVPMTIKDNLDTAGMVTTGGTKGRVSFIPKVDATVVSRLREAGAILVGKTNTPELTLAYETDNLIYGRTNNPYDLSRTSGGSSGGASAILAAGGIPFDIGSDTGGSIRLPSHFCGTAGIRPTSGRVPRTGHIIPPGGTIDCLTQIGPMSRYVEDLVLILPIISGVDWKDPAIIPMPLGNPDDVDISKLRVAFHTDNGIATPTKEIQEAVKSVVDSIANTGASVKETRPSCIEKAPELNAGLNLGDGGVWIKNLLNTYGTIEPHPWIQFILDFAQETRLSLSQFSELFFRLDIFRSQMLSFMESYDVIICPVNATPAISHGSANENFLNFSYTFTYNLTGWPGAVVRVSNTPEGLPIGVQIIARPWREDIAIKVAGYLETVFGGWQKPNIF